MEVDQPPKNGLFETLPHTLKQRIFAKLNKKDRSFARGVCLNWAKLVNEFGIHLVMNNKNHVYLLTVPRYRYEVEGITLKNFTCDQVPRSTRLFKYLKTLEITETLSPLAILRILMSCQSLENLIFAVPAFGKELFSRAVEKFDFRPEAKLKTIQILMPEKQWNFSEDEYFILAMLNFFDLENLKFFALIRENSKISSPDTDFSIAGNKDFELNWAALIRLVETSITLEIITKFILRAKPSLKKLHLENISELMVSPKAHQETLPVLSELSGVVRVIDGWQTFLYAQNSLAVLRLELFWEVWEAVELCIRRCANTLKDLKLVGFYGVDPTKETLKLDFLSEIHNMRTLQLECPHLRKDIKELPKKLRSFCIDSPILKEDVISITTNAPNLKRFCLKNYGFNSCQLHLVGQNEPKILDLEFFKQLIVSPRIEKITFKHCMLMRMDIVKFCEDMKTEIRVKSEPATIKRKTIGYLYNMEVDILSPRFSISESSN